MSAIPSEVESTSSGHVEHVSDVQGRQQLNVVGVVLVTDVQVLRQARWVGWGNGVAKRVQYFSHAVHIILVVF